MKQFRQAQIRAYFFGQAGDSALGPNSQMVDFDDLSIFRIIEGKDPPLSSKPHVI